VIEQEGEGIINQSGVNDVVVVEDENEIVRDGVDLIEQGRQNRFGRRWMGRPEHPQHPFSDIRRNGPQRGDEVSQKACGVAVRFVQRQPGGRPTATGEPFTEERGFAEAGGGRDEGQFAVQALVQSLDQARSEDDSRPRRGEIEFGG
jgi:hypothetical protein